MNRQRLILFILLIILVVALIWSYISIPRQKTISHLKQHTPGQQSKPVAISAKSVSGEYVDGSILKIALLEQEQLSFNGYRRNIFKPVFVDELKMLKQKAAAIKPPFLPPAPPPKSVLMEPVKAVAVRAESAPLARFTFLGFLGKDAHRTIFLAKDNDIILVKKGDKVAGRYEASVINDQALTLIVTDTGDEIVIPLIENRPLSAAK